MILYTHKIEVGSYEQLAKAGYMAGAFFSETYRAYKRSIKAGINTFFVPGDNADPRYILTRIDGRFNVVLEYSHLCPRCLVTCLFKNKADPREKLYLERLIREFLGEIEKRLRDLYNRHILVNDPEFSNRAATALVVGAPREVVKGFVSREAGKNFKHGFAAFVKEGGST